MHGFFNFELETNGNRVEDFDNSNNNNIIIIIIIIIIIY